MSSLLPKRTGDFTKREYWDQFFNSRRSTFEWYGDFVQHSSFFNKYVKKTDSVLIVGCGNSELGIMLYDQIGCSSVLNIDNSELVIHQMLKKAQDVDTRPGLRYECLDVFHLKERIVLEALNPFTCVIDKGTLDAIHSDESSEETASRMFDNVTSALKVMGRYIIITLAQEHIVKSICEYFLRSSDQWLVNCHQLTSNMSNGQDMNSSEVTFPLPLFGIVMTKLLPSTELPRVFIYPVDCNEAKSLHGPPDHPTNLERQLITWISQEQNYSLLRHDISSGHQTSFRFACPVTGLTMFYFVITRVAKHAKLLQRGHNPFGNEPGAIDAVFLVPFGQNRCSLYTKETDRRSLCTSLDVHSVLVTFVNQRVFFPDLDSIKQRLSDFLGTLHLQPSTKEKHSFPIFSTPDSYVRSELSVPQPDRSSFGFCVDQVEVHVEDDKRVTLRRLLCPSSDFRPVLTSNAARVQLECTLSPRDLSLVMWTKLLECENLPTQMLHVGLPFLRSSCHTTVHHVIPLGLDLSEVKTKFEQLYSGDFKGTLSWGSSLVDLDDDLVFDAVFYDPSAVKRSVYRLLFSADSMDKLRDACSVHLKRRGYLVVFIESGLSECGETEVDCALIRAHLTATAELEHVFQYSIPDSLIGDPSTIVLMFRLVTNRTPADETRIDLFRRIEYLRKKEEQENELLTATYNVLKSVL
ncbi:uncharacterized protein DEA37_0012768 [Paragonimus westermani]|uniref:Uncharacterized protein n=1 Tax=Paragonimus westermani TaxID=34504 RepID=A0A5J4NWL4_9TREM|nr:uncharacterized protein DEA37_0012768 [Paragonimus westermani]